MRRLAATALVLAMASPAAAWQVAPPVSRGEPSPDGRTYLLVNPLAERHLAACVLVRRRDGAPAWSAPTGPATGAEPPPSLRPEPGDRVLSAVERAVPADQRCLDGAQGYVLFDSHAQPGYDVVLERRDAAGKVVWAKRLENLFTPVEIRTFPDLGGARSWTWGWWLDEARGEVVVLGRGGLLRRVALSDGSRRDDPVDEEALLREHVAADRESERRGALAAAEERKVSGLVPLLEKELEVHDGRADAWRLEVAAALLRRSDHARAWEELLGSLRPDRPEQVRRQAANALHKAVAAASSGRRARVLALAREIGSAEARWLVENAGS